MEVMDKPGAPQPPKKGQVGQPLVGGGGWWVRGRETKVVFFAGRFAFVVVGTMFTVMVIISFFMLWVSFNEPYLQPSVVDDTLHQNKTYLQFEGENFYHELALGNQPADIVADEVTQIPKGKSFKIIFTPKQLDIPENYRIYLKDNGQGPDGGFTRQSKYLKGTVDGNFYTMTVTPTNGVWTPGRYEIEMPDSGMFGGKWYAYFTITE